MAITLYHIKLFVVTFIVFTAIDLCWLGFVMQKFYSDVLGSLARHAHGTLMPHWPSAIIAYVLLVFGLIYFVFPYALSLSIEKAAIQAALYGFVIYGIYEFTNYSTLVGWPMQLVIVDTVWGVVLFALTTVIIKLLVPWLV